MPTSLRRKMLRFYKTRGFSCHLCGLPIPDWLSGKHHPLAKTADHLVPRSLGGPDKAFNKKPAHACCNHYRGVRPISGQLVLECRWLVVVHFAKIDLPAGRRWKVVRRMLRRYGRKNPKDAEDCGI